MTETATTAPVTTTACVDEIVATIAAESGSAFTPGRYPRTYALDYLRSHREHFTSPPSISRSEASAVLAEYAAQTGQDPDEVRYVLADAYTVEHKIKVNPAVSAAAGVENGYPVRPW